MFTIYHCNQLDVLKHIAISIITERTLNDPFNSEVIIVQNNGIAEWINIELAYKIGISANMNFFLPDSFIWKICRIILPEIPIDSDFSKSVITWRVMEVLPRILSKRNKHSDVIKKYLCNDNNYRKYFQFSERVADLFDKYIVFRPDWLDSWQNRQFVEGLNDDQFWQAQIWRELTKDTQKRYNYFYNRSNVYKRVIQILDQRAIEKNIFPERVSIFGAIQTTYLPILQALGRHIDINLFFTNPCRYYWWGDDERLLIRTWNQKKFINSSKNSMFFSDNNPLLDSWGKIGRDTLYFLYQLEGIQDIDSFVEPVGDSLLNLLQKDILDMEDKSIRCMKQFKSNRRILNIEDRSICLHVCHSLQREVEVLHENLLTMLSEDSTLSVRDIIVMVADIDRYIPAIKSVFGSHASSNRYLPFTISDCSMHNMNPIFSKFLKFLDLPSSRFSSEEILEFLNISAVADKFGINEEDIKFLHNFVNESGIRWGLDNDTQNELMLPVTGQNTWEFGLNRMLLGYAMDSKNGDWNGILPYDESREKISDLVGNFVEFLIQLRRLRDQLSKERKLISWLPCAKEIIENFFNLDTEEEAALYLLELQWKKIIQNGIESGYEHPVPIRLLREKLFSILYQEKISNNFISGSINFCTLISMRAIPFKVICLLGMNDGIYPRIRQSVGFDLMVLNPRRGDRSSRDDDSYLFLEVLLSVQNRLYISFIGRSIQDNTRCYPSVLVSELCEYITQSFYLPGDELTDQEISSERVHAHLLQLHSSMSSYNFTYLSKNNSFYSELLPTISSHNRDYYTDFIQPLDPISIKNLSFEELYIFYRNPVRSWFHKRLKIHFFKEEQEIRAEEPFTIDGLTIYNMNKKILNTLINNEDINRLYNKIRSEGILPYGYFGDMYWYKQCNKIKILYDKIQKYLDSSYDTNTSNVDISLHFGDIELTGYLHNFKDNGLLRWRPAVISMIDCLLFWLEHLTYCAIGGKGDSRMFGINSGLHFSALPSNQAKSYLWNLVSGYFKGMISPLLLLNRSGGAWINHSFDRQTRKIDWKYRRQQQARDRLIESWQGNRYHVGEGKDPYLQRLVKKLDNKDINKIINAAKYYFLQPLIFNIMYESDKRNS